MVTTENIKLLRERTGAGMMECKAALTETGGDIEKAIDLLRQRGIAKADKKAGREATQGLVGSYIHGDGKIGVLIEVGCETDFVARNSDFQQFVKDVAMHIAASSPLAVAETDLDPALLERERQVYLGQVKEEGKPEKIAEKIVEGKLRKFKQESVLLSQEYIKNPELTVEQYLKSVIGKIGENIVIRRFARFQLGQ